MKKILSFLLAACLLLGAVSLPAGASYWDAGTMEGFLGQMVEGMLYDYDCDAISAKENTETLNYVNMLMKISCMPSCVDLDLYGIKTSYNSTGYKVMDLSDAKWLCQNIFNWSEETWEGLLAHANSNKTYIGNSKYKQGYIRGEKIYLLEGARGSNTVGVDIITTQKTNSRTEVVFNCRKQPAPTAAVYIETYYAMIEQKSIGGKSYWTVYKTRKLKEGENPLKVPVGGFSDVYADAFYADAVKWAVENNITSGKGDGRFDPTGSCTRGEIVTFLWRAAGKPTVSGESFSDVPAGAFYEDAVKWAAKEGITLGAGGKFNPNGICTRAEIVTFLWRANGKPTVSGDAFSDVPAGAYFEDAVKWAVKNEITFGAGGLFNSNGQCDRSQAVTFLYRAKTK